MSTEQPPPPDRPPPPGNYPPPPTQPPPPGNYSPQQPYQQPGEPPKKKRSGCLVALAIVGVLGILGLIAVVALVVLAADSVDEALDEAAAELEAEEEEPIVSDAREEAVLEEEAEEPEVVDEPLEDPAVEEVDGPAAGDEALDVSSCAIVDEFTVSFDVTNNSSKQSSYIIDANYLDEAGTRIGDEPFFMNYIRPGERAVEGSFGSVPENAASCEVAEVERFAAESTGDLSEVTCEVVGLDFADDIDTELIATNGSSGLSDYVINFAVIRDGLRVGSGFGSIENVKAGESAPSQGFSTVDGPTDGVTCEVVEVTRVAS